MKIGCDVVDVKRIEKILNSKIKNSFINKILSTTEIQHLKLNANSLAGYFAAKEAALKALGVGISPTCTFKDVLLSKDNLGQPLISFSDKTIKEFNIKNASLSISHDAGIAMAVVLVEFNNV